MATTLTLTQQQKIQTKLSPAQIQVMRMLELPACELQARINEELQENIALEEGYDSSNENEELIADNQDNDYENPLQNDDFDYGDYVDDDNYERGSSNQSQGEFREEIPYSAGISFGEYLKSQVYLIKGMDKSDRHIAKFVIGNIDEKGYLRRSAEELVDDLIFREGLEVSDEKMKEIIAQIRQFDPPGVAAYDLQDCLTMQLKQKEPTPSIQLATTIIDKYFDIFTRKQFSKIMGRLEISEEQLKAAIAEINRLNPYPGNNWMGTIYEGNQTVVIPDFIVEQEEDDLIVTLNQGDIPTLRVSPEYNAMLEEYSHKDNISSSNHEAARFLKSKVESAKWFIDALQQRNTTLLETMRAIVAFQREFFLEGDSTYLKPMVLKDIADITHHDASTISRACSGKYVQTNFGIFSLKHFFSEGMVKKDGEEISTREIKQKVKELVDNEDKTRPLTDDDLVNILHECGYDIARRTVAKYREQLGIPVARMRHNI